MTREGRVVADPQQELVAAAAAANSPEPTAWVRAVQLLIAAAAMGAAIAVALILVLQGQPAPNEPAEAGAQSQEQSGAPRSQGSETGMNTSAPAVYRFVGEAGAAGGETEPEAEGESASEGESESLANLSKQGPWAFAIVAMLVAAFVATGKSLNFSAPKSNGDPPEATESTGSTPSAPPTDPDQSGKNLIRKHKI
jgi:hypothetical protein